MKLVIVTYIETNATEVFKVRDISDIEKYTKWYFKEIVPNLDNVSIVDDITTTTVTDHDHAYTIVKTPERHELYHLEQGIVKGWIRNYNASEWKRVRSIAVQVVDNVDKIHDLTTNKVESTSVDDHPPCDSVLIDIRNIPLDDYDQRQFCDSVRWYLDVVSHSRTKVMKRKYAIDLFEKVLMTDWGRKFLLDHPKFAGTVATKILYWYNTEETLKSHTTEWYQELFGKAIEEEEFSS